MSMGVIETSPPSPPAMMGGADQRIKVLANWIPASRPFLELGWECLKSMKC